MRRPRFAGFTLVEMLVVMAVVSLLVALLLPSLARAKFTAEAMMCTARIRQMGVAVHLYTDDQHGYFMSLPYDPNNLVGVPYSYAYGAWEPAIAPYMGYAPNAPAGNYRTAAFPGMQCPSEVTGAWVGAYHRYVYAFNWALQQSPTPTPNQTTVPAGYGWGTGLERPQKIDNIKRPSKVDAFVDCGTYATMIHGPFIDTYGISGHPVADIASPNHAGRGIGMVFVDGHASFWYVPNPYDYTQLASRPPWWSRSFFEVPQSRGWQVAYPD